MTDLHSAKGDKIKAADTKRKSLSINGLKERRQKLENLNSK